jgi:hypothetical protein
MVAFRQLSKLAGSIVVAALVFTVSPAVAANYHFVGSKSCTSSVGTVTCSFSVAGLGNASTATAEIQAPFQCAKYSAGKNYTAPGGLASSGAQTFAVRNGRIDVTDLQLSGSCPDHFNAAFTGPVSVYVNGVFVGTIPIT